MIYNENRGKGQIRLNASTCTVQSNKKWFELIRQLLRFDMANRVEKFTPIFVGKLCLPRILADIRIWRVV